MQSLPYMLRGVILPLAIGGLIAYLYPSLQAYFRSPSSLRQGRVEKLVDEYRTIRQLAGDRSLLITRLMFHFASLLGQLAILVLVTTIHLESLFGNFLGLMIYGYVASSCLAQVNMVQRIINNTNGFRAYREKTIAELKRFGRNLEDLEKEEP